MLLFLLLFYILPFCLVTYDTYFYNTRDVETWPEPEVLENVNTDELGDLGLTADEEAAIVTFMKTLSDGYIPE